MNLPDPAWQWVYGRIAWAIVLTALVLTGLSRRHPVSRTTACGVALAVAGLQWLPGLASPTHWLALALQWPSAVSVALAVGVIARVVRGRAAWPVMPAVPAFVLAVAGAVLYLDASGWAALNLYNDSFGPRAAPLIAIALALACVVAIVRAWHAASALALMVGLVSFMTLRLPTGNLWDALIDPMLWLLALGSAVTHLRSRPAPTGHARPSAIVRAGPATQDVRRPATVPDFDPAALMPAPVPPSRHPVVVTAVVLQALLLVAAWLSLRGDARAARMFFIEDGAVEWLQFLCFATLSLVLVGVACHRGAEARRINLPVLVLAGLGCVVALAAAEEISWFQRVLGLQTPEYFKQNNRQNELNLHNLAIGGSSVNKLLLVKAMFLIGIVHNLVLPLATRRWPGVQAWVERHGLYLPPLAAALPYLVLVALSQWLLDHPRRGELSEVFGAIHYLTTVFAAYVLGVGYGGAAVIENLRDRMRVAWMFVPMLGLLAFFAWLLGAGYLRGPAAL